MDIHRASTRKRRVPATQTAPKTRRPLLNEDLHLDLRWPPVPVRCDTQAITEERTSGTMDQGENAITGSFRFILGHWPDDVAARSLQARRKYPDVILPDVRCCGAWMRCSSRPRAPYSTPGRCSTRRASPEQRAALCAASGQAFYNTLRASPCATSSRAGAASSNCSPTSRTTSTVSRQRSGHPRQLQVPQPALRRLSKSDGDRHAHRQVRRPRDRPLSPPAGIGQPHHGHGVRWSWSENSMRRNTRKQASIGRPRDAVRLMARSTRLPADRRTSSSPVATCSTTVPAARAVC